MAGVEIKEDKFVYSHHAQNPAYLKLCNAFGIVRIHKFGDLDDKASFRAMCDFAMQQDEVRLCAANERLSEAEKDFAESVDDEWKNRLQRNHNRFLGYTKNEEGGLVIVPEEADIVRRIYAEYMDERSLLQIKRGIEADGILNGAGNAKWHESNIKQILSNEKYIGDALLQKTYTVNTLEKKRVTNKVRLETINSSIKEKQTELLKAGNDQNRIDEIGDAIIHMREQRQDILIEAAQNKERKERVDDLVTFLGEQVEAIMEYSEPLVRRLIERIVVYDEKMMVTFKSGLEIEVNI